jgi:hypothetical protein
MQQVQDIANYTCIIGTYKKYEYFKLRQCDYKWESHCANYCSSVPIYLLKLAYYSELQYYPNNFTDKIEVYWGKCLSSKICRNNRME